MPSLKTLQKGFVASAYGPVSPAFAAAVTGGGKLRPREAVDVYRRGYPARMAEALGETFEACWRVLGDENFLKACEAYARSVPSVSHNLSDYGRSFPEFLDKRFGRGVPFIRDLAVLEWEFKNIFHAVSHDPLPADSLARAVKDDSVLIFGSAVKLLSMRHSVHQIWLRDRSDDTPLDASAWTGRQRILLYRSGETSVGSSVLAVSEASALTSLMKGRRLRDALAEAKGLDEAVASKLFSFLATAGLVTEVR